MVMLYLVILIVAAALLLLPGTRRALRKGTTLVSARFDPHPGQDAAQAARTAAGAAGNAARSAKHAARSVTDAARGAGDAVATSIHGRQLRTLGQTLLIHASVEQVAPVLTRAMEETALLDATTPRAGEHLAWTYSSLAETRFVAAPDSAGDTVFGVVSFEYAMEAPQGVAAADRAIAKARAHLTEEAIDYDLVARAFQPGPEVMADGIRTALPLA